jgi:hypothetical protein
VSTTAERAAKSEAGKAKDDAKASLIAERDGACKTLVGGAGRRLIDDPRLCIGRGLA